MAKGKPDWKGYGQWWKALLTKPAVAITIVVVTAICINPNPVFVFWALVIVGIAYFLLKPIYINLVKPSLLEEEGEDSATTKENEHPDPRYFGSDSDREKAIRKHG